MTVRPKYLLRNVCQYCGRETYGKHRRKYCSYDCSELAQGGADRYNGRLDKDPTPEQIAEMCRQIRDGEIVVSQGAGSKMHRQKANWVGRKR